jgi:uncharacterized coiled-coil protein SlyX
LVPTRCLAMPVTLTLRSAMMRSPATAPLGGNTAIGAGALSNNVSGILNTAIGADAGANVDGILNICIGEGVIGVAGENNTIRIGDNLPNDVGASACYIGGIYNQAIDPVTAAFAAIDNSGKLGTMSSSRRYKKDIQSMDKASEAIFSLKPVTFHYKSDAKNTPCFGLVAEDVAEVNPDLVVRDKDGEIYTVRYDAVNAMLLNEFLNEHRKVEVQQSNIEKQEVTMAELKSMVAEQRKGMEILRAQLKEQAAQIQKVSAQVEMSKAATQLAVHRP